MIGLMGGSSLISMGISLHKVYQYTLNKNLFAAVKKSGSFDFDYLQSTHLLKFKEIALCAKINEDILKNP